MRTQPGEELACLACFTWSSRLQQLRLCPPTSHSTGLTPFPRTSPTMPRKSCTHHQPSAACVGMTEVCPYLFGRRELVLQRGRLQFIFFPAVFVIVVLICQQD